MGYYQKFKTRFLISTIFLIPLLASAQAELGKGIVVLDFGMDYINQISFYKDSAAKNLIFTMKGFDGADGMPIAPYDQLGAPPRLYFRCVDSANTMFKVYVIDSTGKTAWVKKDKTVYFLSWLDYLKSFSRIELGFQNIHTAPNDSSGIIKEDSICNTAEILLMKDDWIRIQTEERCFITDQKPMPITVQGWVKWRNRKKLFS